MRPEINARVDLCYDSPSSGNAVSKYGDYTMTYDEIGNPISYKGYSMAWTKAKQLASVSGNGITMSFKYDSNGIRTLKRVNGVDTEFTYAGTTLVSQKTGNEIINFAYTAGGAPYGFTYNGTNYFYLLNLQGDVIGIYDSTGTVVVKYAYDSWGQLMSITGTLADTIGVKNPLRYRGYYYDTETKLYYLQSRYYDPETCHFISMDSYFVAGDYINGMNMYAYCLNNPVMYVDPTGCAPDFMTAIYILCAKFLTGIGENNIDHIMAYNKACDAIGFSIHNGEVQNVFVEYMDSGVCKVTMVISGYATPDSKRKETFYAVYCYGTGKQWLEEYQYYYYHKKQEVGNIVMKALKDLALTAIGFVPVLGDAINMIATSTSYFPDHYETSLNRAYDMAQVNQTQEISVMVAIWTEGRNVYFSSKGMI